MFIGDVGTGKTYQCVQAMKLLAENEKKVMFIDPEFGAEREFLNLGKEWWDTYGDNIILKVTPSWKDFKNACLDKETKVFLKIIDGFREGMNLYRKFLEDKYKSKGYYIIGDKQFEIKDPDAWKLPWNLYPVVYDAIRDLIYELLKTEYEHHLLATAHHFGETDARERLKEDVFGKFDTVIELKASKTGDTPTWWAIIHKNRGREKPDQSNVLKTGLTEKLLTIWQKVI